MNPIVAFGWLIVITLALIVAAVSVVAVIAVREYLRGDRP